MSIVRLTLVPEKSIDEIRLAPWWKSHATTKKLLALTPVGHPSLFDGVAHSINISVQLPGVKFR